jgi:hypothetical protein
VHAHAGVAAVEVGVIAAPCAAGIGEHQNALGVVHEGLGLGQVGGRWAVDDGKDVAGECGLAHDAPSPPRDFGHRIGAEVVEDLIQCGLHGGQGGEMLDELVAAGLGLLAVHGLAINYHRPREQVALVI